MGQYSELAAAKIAQAKEILDKYPEGTEIPEDKKSEVVQLFGEFEEASKQAQEENKLDEIRTKVQEGHEFYHKGLGSPAKGKTRTDTKSEWKSMSEWVYAVALAGQGKVDKRLTPMSQILIPEEFEELKVLSGDIGASGGYLIPTEFVATVLMKPAEAAIVRPRATPVPMSHRAIQIPALDQTAVPAGGTAFFGGIVFEWIEESEEKPEVDIAWRQIELTAHECAGWLPVPNSLLSDSAVSLEALIPTLFGKGMSDEEDYRFLRGTGVGQPVGVVNAPATLWVVRAGANAFDFADVVGMLESLQPGANAIWVMSQTVMDQVYTLTDPNNRYMWIPNMSGAGPGTLMGRPIIYTEKLPALGTQGDVLLCDFSYYLIGDRETPSLATSSHERFRRNQTTFRISERVDGQPWLSAAITLRDGATQISPFVGLN